MWFVWISLQLQYTNRGSSWSLRTRISCSQFLITYLHCWCTWGFALGIFAGFIHYCEQLKARHASEFSIVLCEVFTSANNAHNLLIRVGRWEIPCLLAYTPGSLPAALSCLFHCHLWICGVLCGLPPSQINNTTIYEYVVSNIRHVFSKQPKSNISVFKRLRLYRSCGVRFSTVFFFAVHQLWSSANTFRGLILYLPLPEYKKVILLLRE